MGEASPCHCVALSSRSPTNTVPDREPWGTRAGPLPWALSLVEEPPQGPDRGHLTAQSPSSQSTGDHTSPHRTQCSQESYTGDKERRENSRMPRETGKLKASVALYPCPQMLLHGVQYAPTVITRLLQGYYLNINWFKLAKLFKIISAGC